MMLPLIIGVGNPFRGDDGAGSAVLERLQSVATGRADLMVCTGDPAGLLSEWQGREQVILIDACRHDVEQPGTIFRVDGLGESFPIGAVSTSSHAFSIADVIELGKQLDALPESLIVYAVVGHDLSPGNRLSAPVERAVNEVCNLILREIASGDQACTNTPC